MDIGFIGLGNMGYPMARRLVEAGHKLVVYDTSGQMMSRLTSLGAVAAKSAKDVADQVETVMASLPTPDIVLAVATGPDGVIEGKKVKRFLDMSTTGSRMAIKVAEALAAKGITGIDLPVSGGVGGAEKGTVAVMYAGPRAGFDELKDVLSVVGKPFYIGEKPGMGQTMKLCNNLLSAANMALSAEMMVMGAKAGLDPQIMVDVINVSSGANTAIRDKFPKAVMPGTFDYGFYTGLMYKDVRLCVEEGEAMGVPMPLAGAVHQMWVMANAVNGPGSDFTEITKIIEKWAGVDPPVGQPPRQETGADPAARPPPPPPPPPYRKLKMATKLGSSCPNDWLGRPACRTCRCPNWSQRTSPLPDSRRPGTRTGRWPARDRREHRRPSRLRVPGNADQLAPKAFCNISAKPAVRPRIGRTRTKRRLSGLSILTYPC